MGKPDIALRRRIQELAAAGLTQREIALETGRSPAYVSVIVRELRSRYYLTMLERMARNAPPGTLQRYCGMSDFEVDALKNGMWSGRRSGPN